MKTAARTGKAWRGEESTRMDRMPLRGLGWLGEGGDYMKGEKTAARTGGGREVTVKPLGFCTIWWLGGEGQVFQ